MAREVRKDHIRNGCIHHDQFKLNTETLQAFNHGSDSSTFAFQRNIIQSLCREKDGNEAKLKEWAQVESLLCVLHTKKLGAGRQGRQEGGSGGGVRVVIVYIVVFIVLFTEIVNIKGGEILWRWRMALIWGHIYIYQVCV